MGIINRDRFDGRIALHDGDIEALYEVASLCKTYVEIGTLFGASACIAGLAGCDVYCIDPLDGYNIRGAPDGHDPHKTIPSPILVQHNWLRQGLELERLHLYAQYHPPWPREIDHRFDAGLIDGNHYTPNVWLDYIGMRDRVNYLMFHDSHLESVKFVCNTVKKLPMWEEYIPETKKERTLLTLRRI